MTDCERISQSVMSVTLDSAKVQCVNVNRISHLACLSCK